MGKNNYFLFLLSFLSVFGITKANAAVTSGTYTIGSGGNYATVAAALSDLGSSTITGPVVFNFLTGTYSSTQISLTTIAGASSANTVTFQSATGNAADVTISYAGSSTSNNYIFKLDGTQYVNIRNLTLNNTGSTYGTSIWFTNSASNDSVTGCVLQGSNTTTSSNNKSRIYANPNNGTGIVIQNNTIDHGSYGMYWYGSSTSNLNSGTIIEGNTFRNNYYSAIYAYYNGGTHFNNNTITTSGVSTFYNIYFYYPQEGLEVKNNTATVSASSTVYGLYAYYGNVYSSSPSATPIVIQNNTININNNYGSVYAGYFYHDDYMQLANNTFNTNSYYGSVYAPYYLLAYAQHSKAEHNVFNTSNPYGTVYSPFYGVYSGSYNEANDNKFNVQSSSGSVFCPYYGMYSSTGSKMQRDTFDVTNPSGYVYHYYTNAQSATDTCLDNYIHSSAYSIYNYAAYYHMGYTHGNLYDLNASYGSIYDYFYYGNGGIWSGNTVRARSSSGSINGMYMYMPTTSYSGATIIGNKFDLQSDYGTVYGLYAYYLRADKLISNSISVKTGGSSYLFRSDYGLYGDATLFNNTFHSNSTGGTNYLMYFDKSSYSGNLYAYNNIFSTSNAATSSVYIKDANVYHGDYNLFYNGGSPISMQCNTPSVTATSLGAWRAATKRDINSLNYAPAYTDAANGDLTPDASNPNSWSMQGRGIHMVGDTLDFNGNARPKTPDQGVPDLGAYEFTPSVLPPDAVAVPATPSPSSTQVFTFGEDTVGTIEWGNGAPSSVSVKQYTGIRPSSGMPSSVGRMYFYTAVNTAFGLFDYKPTIRYKDPWIGDVSSETNARIARQNGSSPWEGFNYTNGITDTDANTLSPLHNFDTLPSKFTGVENARIGIRCVVPPSGLAHSDVAADSANESWNAEFNPFGYQVIVDNSPNDPVKPYSNIQFSAGNNLQLKNLAEDTKYYVHVRTICGALDTSGWAIDSFTTLITCHAPRPLVSNLTSNHAVISWDTVKTAYEYEYVFDQSPTDPGFGTRIHNNTMLLTSLAPNTTYYFHVSTFCNSVYPHSLTWSTVQFTTPWPAGIDDPATDVMTAYPNPTKDVVNILLADKYVKDATLQLTDLRGRVVRTQNVVNTHTTVDLLGLPAGVYTLRYTSADKTAIIKVTKQ